MTESAMPLVTIAIPTYNRPHDLKKIIKIAVGQTHKNLEILIVDNCSTQSEVVEVMQWAAALDPRIKCHRNPENYGVLKNARCALDLATGKYFCLFSDDDWRAPEFIETLVGLLEKDPSAHLAFCDYREITDNLNLAPGYPSQHLDTFKPLCHPDSNRRLWSYYLQDHKNGKCNLFYSLFLRSSLSELNFEALSKGYTSLSMDKYVVMAMLKKSKLAFSRNVLCALRCQNAKLYTPSGPAAQQPPKPSRMGRLGQFYRDSREELEQACEIGQGQPSATLLRLMFLPKFAKEVAVRLVPKSLRMGSNHPSDSAAIRCIERAESATNQTRNLSTGVNKKQLSAVTLVAVATKDVEKTAMAMRYSMTNIQFGQAILLAHYKPWNLGECIQYTRIQPFKSVDDWGQFVIYDLHRYIDTDFIFLVHADGFVANPEQWDDRFLQYDYIGSPWPNPKDPISYRDEVGTLYRVGNSVSIRSKKILELPSRLKLPWEPFNGFYNEDGFLCVKHRKAFEAHGIRYGELDIAALFAHERMLPETKNIRPFAFHKWQGTNSNYPRFKAY